MTATLAGAIHAAAAAATALGGRVVQPSPSPSPSPLDAWPEQALAACAPEGGYWPGSCAPDDRTLGLCA
jgi:hypothetical protein